MAAFTTMMQYQNGCTRFLEENGAWHQVADTVGVLSAKNAGGINPDLVPHGLGELHPDLPAQFAPGLSAAGRAVERAAAAPRRE